MARWVTELAIALAVAFAAPAAAQVSCPTVTSAAWQGYDDPSRSWSNGANWTTGTVPDACTAVTISNDPDLPAGSITDVMNIPAGAQAYSLAASPGTRLFGADLTIQTTLSWATDDVAFPNRINATVTVLGTTTISGDGDTFLDPGTLVMAGGGTIQGAGTGGTSIDLRTGGQLTFRATVQVRGTGLQLEGATTGTFTNEGTLQVGAPLEASSLTGHALFVNQLGIVAFELGSSVQLDSATVLLANGSALQGPGAFQVSGASSVVNLPGTVALSSGAILRTTGGQLTGTGTLAGTGGFELNGGHINGDPTLAAGITTTVGGPDQKFVDAGADITNHGTFDVLAGQIVLRTSGTTTFANSGTLRGGGTLQADVTNSGTVAPGAAASPGVLTIGGSYAQTAAGVLEIDMGGATAGSQHDRLVVTGPATLGGTLRVVTRNGFSPAVGETFQVIQHASRTGSFGTLQGVVIDAGKRYDPAYGTTATDLTVIAASAPTLSIADASTAEEAATASLTVTLSRAVDGPVTFHYATADGTASAGADYTGASGDVTIPTGQTSATIPVGILEDAADEPDETLTVTLSSPVDAAIADGTATLTILDDEPAATPTATPDGNATLLTPVKPVGPIVANNQICQGESLLEIGTSIVRGCFGGTGNVVGTRGDLEVDGLVLSMAANDRFVIDKTAGTIATDDATSEVIAHAVTPACDARKVATLGRLKRGNAIGLGAKVIYNLKGTATKAAMETTPSLVARARSESLISLSDAKIEAAQPNARGEIAARGKAILPQLGDATVDAVVRVSGTSRCMVKPGSTMTAPVSKFFTFDWQNVRLDFTNDGIAGVALLRLGPYSSVGASIDLTPGVEKIHLEGTNLPFVAAGVQALIRSIKMDLLHFNNRYSFIGTFDLSLAYPIVPVRLAGAAELRLEDANDPTSIVVHVPTASVTTIFNLGLQDSHFIVHLARKFAAAGGKFGFSSLDGKVSYASAGMAGWFSWGAQPAFVLEGDGQASIPFMPVLDARGVLSDNGLAACAAIDVKIAGVVAYQISVGFSTTFSPFSPAAWVSGGCHLGNFRPATRPFAAAAQAGSNALTLPGGLPGALIAVHGSGGPPKVALVGPGGKAIPLLPGARSIGDAGALLVEDGATTFILVARPAAGTYTLTPAPASPAISKVEVADVLPDPRVTAKLGGRGRARTLRYSVRPVPGQRVEFMEVGRDVSSRIGRARGSKGTLRFEPADAAKGPRDLVAVVTQNGRPRATIRVARYSAPGPAPVPRVRRVAVRRRATRATITWPAVRGADHYAVTVAMRGAARATYRQRGRSLTLSRLARTSRGTVSVAVVGRDLRLGRGRVARVRAFRGLSKKRVPGRSVQ